MLDMQRHLEFLKLQTWGMEEAFVRVSKLRRYWSIRHQTPFMYEMAPAGHNS